MHLDLQPIGPAPQVRRESVDSLNLKPGGINVRYALDNVHWLWDDDSTADSSAFRRLRLNFRSDGSPLRFQVSADQFFWLALDGHIIARGPDASPPWHWAFAQYLVEVAAGDHTLEAFVWWVGDHAAEARMTFGYPGFALAGLDQWKPTLSTGMAHWQISAVHGYEVEPDAPQANVLASGDNGLIDATIWHKNQPPIWSEPKISQRRLRSNPWGCRRIDRVLAPSPLPEMPLLPVSPGRIRACLDEALGENPLPASALNHSALPELQSLLSKEASITIPPHHCRTIIWDLDDYISGYPEITVSGGRDAVIRQIWAESFYEGSYRDHHKGNRNDIAGKTMSEGLGDRFVADGSQRRRFVPYWWRAGRYCLIEITTQDEALTLHHLGIIASGHPFEWVGSFYCDRSSFLDPILAICRRTLEVSSWDTYQDSPYYEQLQYVTDTQIQILITYILNANADLPLHALELFDQSRSQWDGLVGARFPVRQAQLISPFSLIWIWCVRDLMLWRDEKELLKRLVVGTRDTIERFALWRRADGLLEEVPGWPYIDWVTPERQRPGVWQYGVPADGVDGVSSLINLTYLLALQAAAELENALGEPELAARLDRLAVATSASLRERFWDPTRKAIKDDDSGRNWSTQAQIYGILSGLLTHDEGNHALETAARENWLPPSYMFRHYEFEALRVIGRAGEIPDRLEAWQEMVDKGAKTVWERIEPTRSDCHAWSSHPLFHLPCSVAGIRPASPGFREVEIAPQFGPLKQVSTKVSHPRGIVEVDLVREGSSIRGTVNLPPETTGTFKHGDQSVSLNPGTNRIS